MTTGEIGDLMYQMFILAVKLGGPILLISMIVGIDLILDQAGQG